MTKALALMLIILLPTFAAQMKPMSESQPLVLNNITVIDMMGAQPEPNMTVVVVGNRITAFGKAGKVRFPKNAQTIDATGKFLIPGLWDMHVHLSETKTPFPLFIANGVLGVRHMGGNLKQVFEWREAVRQGKLLAPRIVTCGSVVDDKNEPEDVISALTANEGRKAVSINENQGADFIKVYDGISRDAYFALIEETKRQRIPFAGHVPIAITSFEASDAGQRSFEHLGNILRSGSTLPPNEIEQRAAALVKPSGKPGDFSHIPARIAERTKIELATYDKRKAEQLFARFVKNQTWQVPTLEDKRSLSYVDDGSFSGDPRMKYIPAAELEEWKPENSFFLKYRTPEFIRVRKLLCQKEFDLVRQMHRAEVGFLLGTDIPAAYGYTGFTVHDELALFVQAGFTPLEALQTATVNPAKFLGLEKSLGTVEKGKSADLVLLDANPLENIANTKKISAVIVNGKYLPKDSLQKMLADVEAIANKK
ncbi:MAG: amidohydrolase family protein [Acidobacteriota bacterium]|nr:amidohydrolase family protein [Acidobacteriota bacterium]